MIDIAKYKDESYDVLGALYNVKRELGPGLNEKVYQEGLMLELQMSDIPFEKEKAFHPVYRGKSMDSIFYLDFLCKGTIIVELKSVVSLSKDHRAQLFNYMHLVKPHTGILVNFAPRFVEIERYYYDCDADQILKADGTAIKNKYDDYITINQTR